MFLRIGVEVRGIICNMLAQLFFLKFPDIHLLISIRVHFYAFRDFNALFQRPASVHTMHSLFVQILKVWRLTICSVA